MGKKESKNKEGKKDELLQFLPVYTYVPSQFYLNMTLSGFSRYWVLSSYSIYQSCPIDFGLLFQSYTSCRAQNPLSHTHYMRLPPFLGCWGVFGTLDPWLHRHALQPPKPHQLEKVKYKVWQGFCSELVMDAMAAMLVFPEWFLSKAAHLCTHKGQPATFLFNVDVSAVYQPVRHAFVPPMGQVTHYCICSLYWCIPSIPFCLSNIFHVLLWKWGAEDQKEQMVMMAGWQGWPSHLLF